MGSKKAAKEMTGGIRNGERDRADRREKSFCMKLCDFVT